jgi:hypothetical protein
MLKKLSNLNQNLQCMLKFEKTNMLHFILELLCLFFFTELTKLLVANGVNDSDYSITVEVINLDPSNPGLVCDNLPEFPVGLTGATGQLFNKKTPIICGGYNPAYFCDCYALQNQSWTKISSLNQCRENSASALVSLEEEKEVLMITGGGDLSTVLKSVESFDGTEWEHGQLPELPNGVWIHCFVKINATTFLLIGGTETPSSTGATAKTHFFHTDKNQWSPGANVIIKLFTAASYKFSLYAKVLFPGKPSQPSLMFVGKARSLPLSGALER